MKNEWALVPREPTLAQLSNGAYEVPDPISHLGELTARMVYQAMIDAAPAAEVQAGACPHCGSDCNERDELEKAEREIERLRRAPARPEDMAAFAAELKADPVKALAFFQSAGILNERGELTPEYAALQQAEPVGYFVNDESDDQWHQVNYEQRNGADTYPLYLHPPADAPQQAEPRDVCDVCNALTVPRNATHYDADDLKAAQVRGKIIAAKLQQQAEPVAQIGWADEFGNLFPMGAWKPAQRTHHDSHKVAWRPVFLHPPAAPQGEESDAAYTERNHLVALLSTLYPAGKARTAIEGWSPEWHGCVYIDFPWGQASWHYHDRDAGLFNHLAPYRGSWDGHTTEAKYDLIRQAVAASLEGLDKP